MGIKNINDVKSFEELNLRESFRVHMIYEEITGESFRPSSIKNILIYFYSHIMAANKELTIDFEAFVDWMDEHPDYLGKFVDWFTDNLHRNITKPLEVQPQTGEEAANSEPFQSK
jgi:hypothetical protein